MRRRRRWIGNRTWLGERGQAAVEFAIVAPFILLFAFFMIEGVRVMTTWMVLEHATREGARLGAVHKTSGEIQTRTIERSQNILTAANITITGAGGAAGTDVQVAVTYQY